MKRVLILVAVIVAMFAAVETVEAGPIVRGARAFRNREHKPLINAVKAFRNREHKPLVRGARAVGRFVVRRSPGWRFRGHCGSGSCSTSAPSSQSCENGSCRVAECDFGQQK